MATPDQIAQFKLDNWQHALAVSKQTGVDPRIVMAQAGIESGWGTAAPGNNLFGVKGTGQTLQTREVGPDGRSYMTSAGFAAYPSTDHSFAHYAALPVVQKVGAAGDYDAQIAALKKSGYASDPNYSKVVDQTAQTLKVPEGVTPSVLPIVQTTNVDGAGAGGQGVPAQMPPPVDPRTANDADLGGYGSPTASQPGSTDSRIEGLLAAQRAAALRSATAQGQTASQGLLAQGAPTQMAPQQQIPLLQAGRPRIAQNFTPVLPGLRGLLG
jgi:hypothetical protein